MTVPTEPPAEHPILEVRDLHVQFGDKARGVQAVDGISFDLYAGRTCGIVGESGSGKSATALALMALHDERTTEVTGSVRLQGRELIGRPERELLAVRGRRIAMIFQDPISSLNPRRKIRDVISEGLAVWGNTKGSWSQDRIEELMMAVGIDPKFGDRRPHQFSGGQCQRVAIARALVKDPPLILADEPTANLDTENSLQILELMRELNRQYKAAVVFSTHDEKVTRYVRREVKLEDGRILSDKNNLNDGSK